MTIFGNTRNYRGCFHVFTFGGEGRGAKLKLPSGTIPFSGGSAFDAILVTGFNYAQREAVAYVKVFGDRTYSYAFGHDPQPSVLTVQFMGFMVNGTQYSGVVGDVNDRYKGGRISKSPRYGRLCIGPSSAQVLRGFLVGMDSATADPHHSIQQFNLHLQLVEAQ